MVMKERLPALRRWATSFDHILGYARLSDVDAELEQLSVGPRRSPQRIGNAHLADKLAYLRRTVGRPPRRRDFQRQNDLNPTRCHSMTVSGFKIARAFRIVGTNR